MIEKPLKTKKKKKDKPKSDAEVVENPKDTTKTKTGVKEQKNYISSLQDKDPEFFQFLQENDEELLNFDESDSDGEEEEEKETGVHELPGQLEVASDESDFE